MLSVVSILVGDGVAGGAKDDLDCIGVDEPSARSGDGSIVYVCVCPFYFAGMSWKFG